MMMADKMAVHTQHDEDDAHDLPPKQFGVEIECTLADNVNVRIGEQSSPKNTNHAANSVNAKRVRVAVLEGLLVQPKMVLYQDSRVAGQGPEETRPVTAPETMPTSETSLLWAYSISIHVKEHVEAAM